MTHTDMPKKVHHGYNIKRLREITNVKQEGLAHKLGGDWTARRVQGLEEKENIDDETLEKVAKALGIPSASIKNFDEEKMMIFIQNIHDQATGNTQYNHGTININPIETILELVKKNEDLHGELLKSERGKIALLEKMLADKK